jgi:hypothetical protein
MIATEENFHIVFNIKNAQNQIAQDVAQQKVIDETAS